MARKLFIPVSVMNTLSLRNTPRILPTLMMAACALTFLWPSAAQAADGNLDSGDTSWMLISTVLVLLMTLPGLALFYGGLVRSRNVLSVLVQCLVIAGIMSLLWVVYGYGLAAGEGNLFVGKPTMVDAGGKSHSMLFLQHMSASTMHDSIPESVWVMFQMTFFIITPALIVGAFAERMKFMAVLLFSVLWATLSYLPVWHMAWGGGLFGSWGVLDYAGGTVVHINAGIAGLVACIMVGKRKGYPHTMIVPHNVPFTVIGACLLWVGWFGFNAGSAVSAGTDAGMAMITTQVATAAAIIAWVIVEWAATGKPTAVGGATGAVAGLVAITPACGTTTVAGALIIGLASGVICFLSASFLKRKLGYDDSLDVFGVHGVGGIVGALLTGVLLREGATGDFVQQLKSVLVTIIWSGVVSVAVLSLLRVTIGLRVDEADEDKGLDLTAHGESGYNT